MNSLILASGQGELGPCKKDAWMISFRTSTMNNNRAP